MRWESVDYFCYELIARLCYSLSRGFLRSKKVTILLHGCWISPLLPWRPNWTSILLKFTQPLSYTGKYNIRMLRSLLWLSFVSLSSDACSCRRNEELIKQLSTPVPGSEDLHFATQYAQSFISQCRACFWKQHLSYWRNPQYNSIRFFMTTIIGIIFGIIFWNKGQKM